MYETVLVIGGPGSVNGVAAPHATVFPRPVLETALEVAKPAGAAIHALQIGTNPRTATDVPVDGTATDARHSGSPAPTVGETRGRRSFEQRAVRETTALTHRVQSLIDPDRRDSPAVSYGRAGTTVYPADGSDPFALEHGRDRSEPGRLAFEYDWRPVDRAVRAFVTDEDVPLVVSYRDRIDGRRSTAAIRYVLDNDVDLIVLGSSHHRLATQRGPSLSEQLALCTDAPVLTVNLSGSRPPPDATSRGENETRDARQPSPPSSPPPSPPAAETRPLETTREAPAPRPDAEATRISVAATGVRPAQKDAIRRQLRGRTVAAGTVVSVDGVSVRVTSTVPSTGPGFGVDRVRVTDRTRIAIDS